MKAIVFSREELTEAAQSTDLLRDKTADKKEKEKKKENCQNFLHLAFCSE